MPGPYIDTSHLVAVFDADDDLHARAMKIALELRKEQLAMVTSDAVLIEYLTYFSGWGRDTRIAAVDFVLELRVDPAVRVIAHSDDLIARAMEPYRRRPDKSYSMTDCISMVICRDEGITEVLTHDEDFVREGFVALLRQ
ncbi:MAG: PIN domain-containing protein [Chloroflexi bacterium]|nr:PIN domain-containing protein [Chloroflexota bacterium]